MPKEKKEKVDQELIIIDKPSKAITLYRITPEEIAEKLKKYDTLKVIKGDTKSYKEVRTVLTALVHTRTGVEERRLSLGRDYRRLVENSIKNINEAAEMLANPMAPYEKRFRSELKIEDARLDAIEAEKVRLEEERVRNIRAKISEMQAMGTGIVIMALTELRDLSDKLEKIEITQDEYMEYESEAAKVISDLYDTVQESISIRIKLDQEEEERKAKDARLEKVRKKQEADQAIIDEANKAIKAAHKKIDDDKAKLEADKKAEDQRKEKEAFEKEATEKAEAAAAQKLKDATIAEEKRAKLAAAEKVRQEALKPDKEKLIKVADELLDIELPHMKSVEGKKILPTIRDNLNELAENIKEKAQEL